MLKKQGVRTYGIPLRSVTGYNLLVDDVLLMGAKGIYRKWARFFLWYIYTQAELITSLSKNELYGVNKIEYNGFVLERQFLVQGQQKNKVGQ